MSTSYSQTLEATLPSSPLRLSVVRDQHGLSLTFDARWVHLLARYWDVHCATLEHRKAPELGIGIATGIATDQTWRSLSEAREALVREYEHMRAGSKDAL